MKKILLIGIAAAAVCVAPALAADMPVKAAPMAPAFSWSGCYGGIETGGAWGKSRHEDDSGLTIANPRVDGWLIGGTLGCNVQSGNVVWGLENDISWTSLKGEEFDHPPFITTFSRGTKANWLDTLRGRLGIAADRSLWYLTGGLAFSDVKITANDHIGDVLQESNTRTGWTIGVGFEQALADPRWSWKIEYLYVDFGKAFYPGNAALAFANDHADLKESIVRIGLNYRFGDWGKGPVVAKY